MAGHNPWSLLLPLSKSNHCGPIMFQYVSIIFWFDINTFIEKLISNSWGLPKEPPYIEKSSELPFWKVVKDISTHHRKRSVVSSSSFKDMLIKVWDTQPQGKYDQKITSPRLLWRTLEAQIAVFAFLKWGIHFRRAGWGPTYFISSFSPLLRLASLVKRPFIIKLFTWCFKDFSQAGSLPSPEHKDFLDTYSFMRIMYHDCNPNMGKNIYPV